MERMEVLSLDNDSSVSCLWPSVWEQLRHLWPGVVPVHDGVWRVLLVVQRDREWDGLLHDIRLRGVAHHVRRVVDVSLHGFGTKGASGVFTEVDEVVTPDLDSGFSVLWSVPWVDGIDLGGWIVLVVHGLDDVIEVSSNT